MASDAKTQARERVKGAWIAIPTPFTDDGSRIQEDLLRTSVEYYVEDLKVDGIFCGGVMGEFWSLTVPERKRVHQLVVEQAAGRIPIMPHVGHHVLDDMVDLTRHAEEIGADFGIAMNPFYPLGQNEDMIRAVYGALDARTNLPMFLFNTKYSGYSLRPELISELADLENICGIKNPGARDHLLRVQELAGDRLVVADAAEEEWLELHVEHGFQALMSTPELALYQWPGHTPIVDYTALADGGDVDAAQALQGTLTAERDLAQRWIRGRFTDTGVIPIASLKAWLTNMGLPQGPVRLPLLPLTADEQTRLRAEMDTIGLMDVAA